MGLDHDDRTLLGVVITPSGDNAAPRQVVSVAG